MTVLITGGAGYIGVHCALALKEQNRPYVVLDNLATGHKSLVPKGAIFYEGCAGDRQLLARILKGHAIDMVIHLAGSTVVPESVTDPGAYFENNTTVSLNLLRACAEHNVSNLIFSSTAAVYGPNPKGIVSESETPNPQSPYAASKWMTECMIHAFHKAHGLSAIILRYFNVGGADPLGRAGQKSEGATHLIKAGLEAALGQRSSVSIFGTDYNTPDGTGLRDYIHITDLASAHMCALDLLQEQQQPYCKTFNCGYGQAHSVREVLRAIETLANVKLPIHEAPRRPGDLPALMANASAFKKVTSWRPQFDSLDAIIKTALAWEKSQLEPHHDHASSVASK